MGFDVGGIIGGVLGPVLGYEGTRQTNEANREIASHTTAMNMADAQRNRDFQNEQALQQMAFQERMSNTAITRGVQDLKNAGLNPILAGMQSGASTPSGASGSGAQGTAQGAVMENALASFMNVAKDIQSLTRGEAETENVKAQNALIKAQTRESGVKSKVIEKDVPKSELMNDVYDVIRPYVKKIKAAVDRRSDSNATAVSEFEKMTGKKIKLHGGLR